MNPWLMLLVMLLAWGVFALHLTVKFGVLRRLAPEGMLLFTNHFRQFKLEPELLEEFAVENLHPRTVPKDFSRTPKIHGAWAFRQQ